jgi:hypothetical protein
MPRNDPATVPQRQFGSAASAYVSLVPLAA